MHLIDLRLDEGAADRLFDLFRRLQRKGRTGRLFRCGRLPGIEIEQSQTRLGIPCPDRIRAQADRFAQGCDRRHGLRNTVVDQAEQILRLCLCLLVRPGLEEFGQRGGRFRRLFGIEIELRDPQHALCAFGRRGVFQGGGELHRIVGRRDDAGQRLFGVGCFRRSRVVCQHHPVGG